MVTPKERMMATVHVLYEKPGLTARSYDERQTSLGWCVGWCIRGLLSGVGSSSSFPP
jgi:hypothetical protein